MYFVMHLMRKKPFKGDIDLILSAKLQRPSGRSIAFFVAATPSWRSFRNCLGLEKTTSPVQGVCSALSHHLSTGLILLCLYVEGATKCQFLSPCKSLSAGGCEEENMPFLENQTLSLLIAKTMAFCWREGQRQNKTKMCQLGDLGCFLW